MIPIADLLNTIPPTKDTSVRRAHFIGICGVGMAGVAYLLARSGWYVTGEDANLNNLSEWLENSGIKLVEEPPDDKIDICVRTTAVPISHPHVQLLLDRGVRILQRGEVLASLMSRSLSLAISGTHGKTTTSCFATRLLQETGSTVGWCIGGHTPTLGGVAGGQPSNFFVAESDESDGTLAHYSPSVLIVNNIDLDHLEHFDGESDLCNCFTTVANKTRKALAYCADSERAKQALRLFSDRAVTFGLDSTADLRATNIHTDATFSRFDIEWHEQIIGTVTINQPGVHNILNALAALLGVHLLTDLPFERLLPHLLRATEELPLRRYEAIIEQPDLEVRIDYAHHPVEIKAALSMARLQHKGRLRVLFQPHRYTRTLALKDEFPSAFSLADEVILLPVYAASEAPILGGCSYDLYASFRKISPKQRVLLATSQDEVLQYYRRELSSGDMLLIVGAGDVIQVGERLKTLHLPSPIEGIALHSYSAYGTGGKTEHLIPSNQLSHTARLIGCGTNTWFSDLGFSGGLQLLRSTSIPAGDPSQTAYPGELVGSVLLQHLAEKGYSGLEFMAGIPGTLGGWIKSNAGAHGQSISEVISKVTVDGQETYPSFGYRSSDITGCVTSVQFNLKPEKQEVIREKMSKTLASRIDFHGVRSCGSLFKNPPQDFAGRLIESCALKGFSIGGAYIAHFHANILCAGENCTSSDLLAVMLSVRAQVEALTGIRLTPEVTGFPISWAEDPVLQ